MKWDTWLSMDWQQVLGISLSAIGFYIGLMLFTRLMGLRSFSKLSSHDFAMTVAIGSILASTVISDTPALLRAVCSGCIIFNTRCNIGHQAKSEAIKVFNRQSSHYINGAW